MDHFNEPIYVTRPLLPDLERVNERLIEIWKSKWLTNSGDQHKQLEKRLKDYLKVDDLVLFVNGTLALILGLKVLDLTGEVITTPFTFPATLMALDQNRLTPVFCDIEKDTLNIDAEKIEQLITQKTSALLAVHVFGNPCKVEKIQKIADKYNLKVIYDAAHAFGSSIKGTTIGNYGDLTMFSFHATKLFNTIEGGALAIKDKSLVKKLNLLKNFGINSPEEVLLSGTNAKLNEVQAGIGLEVLKIVDQERKKRKKILEIYINGLNKIKGIRTITSSNDESNSFQYFTIEINEKVYGKSRDRLLIELEKCNIYARKYFYPLCSNFAWYNELGSANQEKLPVANKAVNEVLSLPFYGELGIEAAMKICKIIKQIREVR